MSRDPQVPLLEDARPADSLRASWIEALPPALHPYLRLMRLDRPIGTWLLFWPCVFGLTLGAASLHRLPDYWAIVLCGLGSIIMRGAGCTYNDIVDRDFDAKVARTRGRPIPLGAIGVKRAAVFAAAQALAGLAILLQFNPFATIVGASSLFLVACYPFMKRITWWPQAWLGLTFNWGIPFGFAAATGGLALSAYLFYAGCIAWTLGYDTIYAHQDKEDDLLIGVKSSAIRLGADSKPWIGVFYALALGLMLAGGFAAGLSEPFALAMLAVAAHLFWHWLKLDIHDPGNCLASFRSNRDTGALIALALLLGGLARL